MSDDDSSPAGVDLHRFIDIAHMTGRPSAGFSGEGFDPENPPVWNQLRVLAVGAGGLGCELLHCLALSGFSDIHVIDMDTIDLSNLNRQFLFRNKDIGQPKATVAANFINERFPWMEVTPHFGRIEEKSDDFYRSFHIVIMGLDSITARLWLSNKYAELARYQIDPETGASVMASATPIIDGGTEGFRGSARHITFGKTACVECSMYLYPPQQGVPMCTIENVPRVPEHCVLYAKLKSWENEKPFGVDKTGEPNPVDGDDPAHIQWIADRACERQQQFKIEGVIDFAFTQGVVKNVVPAVGFTNAMIAAMCANEALKLATGMGEAMDNYTFYDGGMNGVASYTQQMYADPSCASCQARSVINIERGWTPRDVMDRGVIEQLKPVGSSGIAVTLGAEARMSVAVWDDDDDKTDVIVMQHSKHPSYAAVAAKGSKPLVEILQQDGGLPSVDAEGYTFELDVSGGLFGDRVVKTLLRFLP